MNPQDGQGMRVKPEHVINSLTNQVSNLSLNVANLEALIMAQTEQMEEDKKRIKELEMENKQLHEEKVAAGVNAQLDRLNLEVTPDERGHRERKEESTDSVVVTAKKGEHKKVDGEKLSGKNVHLTAEDNSSIHTE